MLDTELGALVNAPRWCVGFSGGIDSTVLLHLLHQWRSAHHGAPPLEAIHVNHALQPFAPDWQQHCEKVCAALGVPMLSSAVEMERGAGGIEAMARAARYRVFESRLQPGAVLFTAHHQDDQVETFFLRLLRGAGVEGLAGIPRQRRLGQGLLVRPLLDVSRAAIERYAAHHQLAYVTDPSNDDTRLDRNFLRAQVFPLLASRWPAYRRVVTRTGRHMAAAATVLADGLGIPRTEYNLMGDPGLHLPDLIAGSDEVAAARLRLWLRAQGHQAPDSASMAEFLRQLRDADRDAGPQLVTSDYCLQRFGDAVYRLPMWDAPAPTTAVVLQIGAPMQVPGVGAVSLQRADGSGLLLAPGELLTLRWRRGGERCRLSGRTGSRRLKTVWQEWRIPPWWRSRVPLLYCGDELLAIGAIGCCESSRWRAVPQSGQPLWMLHWEPGASAVVD